MTLRCVPAQAGTHNHQGFDWRVLPHPFAAAYRSPPAGDDSGLVLPRYLSTLDSRFRGDKR